MQTFSSREFNQRTSLAQKAAHTAPVFITNRGKPDLVLISHEEYLRLSGKSATALDVLKGIEPDACDIDFDIPPRSRASRRPVEFE